MICVSDIEDLPRHVQGQLFDELLDREVQNGESTGNPILFSPQYYGHAYQLKKFELSLIIFNASLAGGSEM